MKQFVIYITLLLVIWCATLLMSPNVLAHGGANNECDSGLDVSGTDNLVSYTAQEGEIVTGVCIKAGNTPFGDGHSDVLGNGTYEDGCFTVSGVGTGTVTVVRNFESNQCQGISHIDIYAGAAPTPSPTPSPSANPSPSPTPVVTPSPTVTPNPGRQSRLGTNIICPNKDFEVTMDLFDNNQAVKNVKVLFKYNGSTKEVKSNENGRASVSFGRNGNGTITADPEGFPSQAEYIKMPENCPNTIPADPGTGGQVLGASTPQGQVLGASTMAATGTSDLSLAQALLVTGMMLVGGSIYGLRRQYQ